MRDLKAGFPVHTKAGLSLCWADMITRIVRRNVSVKPSDTSSRHGTILRTYAGQSCSTHLRKPKESAQAAERAHPSTGKSKIAGGIPHSPFEAFTANTSEQLLPELKRAKTP